MEIAIIPAWLLDRLPVAADNRWHVNVWLSSVAVLLVFLAAPTVPGSLPHFCLFRALLHIPCPGCGILHGMGFLFRGSLGLAWESNPASFGIVALLMFQLIGRPVAVVLPGKARVISQASASTSKCVLAILFLVWAIRLIER